MNLEEKKCLEKENKPESREGGYFSKLNSYFWEKLNLITVKREVLIEQLKLVIFFISLLGAIIIVLFLIFLFSDSYYWENKDREKVLFSTRHEVQSCRIEIAENKESIAKLQQQIKKLQFEFDEVKKLTKK